MKIWAVYITMFVALAITCVYSIKMLHPVPHQEQVWEPYDSRFTFYGDSGKCDLTVEYRKGRDLTREITFEDIICDEAVSIFDAD